ncbi:protein toll-like [Chrysoperla carnea]|uniref:protein toll-like n=1 Tax=Chrysoperla carnea TaxID=189513 RepID=UPI001D092EC5|nr:protein toll-like [Chrysoperla carnea]
MLKQISIICIVITFFVQKIHSEKCEIESPFCDCQYEDRYFKYQCISDRKDESSRQISSPIYLHVDPSKADAQVQCAINSEIEDYDALPEFSIQYLEKFTIYYCPINENFTFENFLRKLNVHTVKEIVYIMSPSIGGTFINGDFFESMGNLTTLTLKVNPDTIIHSDLLKNLEKLVMLTVRKGHIKFTPNFFETTSQIQWIEFSESNGQDLPGNIFQNLYNLKKIGLWNMNISTLNESIFHSLENLNILDLTSNKLETLPETIFQRLQNLEIINLNFNRFVSLPSQIFQNNKNLTEIKLSNNANSLTLSNGLFSNLPNLKGIFLKQSKIENVSEDIFWNSSNIINISLKENQLEYLPEMLFRDAKNLLNLDLSRNKITSIPEKLFKSLDKLEELDLSVNQISSISDNFKYQVNLLNLNLGNNSLTRLEHNAFPRSKSLISLILRHNQLSFDEYSDPFNNLLSLQYLDLSHNNITSILYSWRNVLTSMRNLNLAYNQIKGIEFDDIFFGRQSHSTTLDLRNNLIHTINLQSAEYTISTRTLGNTGGIYDARSGRKSDQIIISNNPLNCNCNIHNLVRYFKRDGRMIEVRGAVELIATDLKCAGPKELQDHDVKDLELTDLFCPISPKDCPQKCNCKARKLDRSTFVDCSNNNLTTIPSKLPQIFSYPNIKLYINNNNLSNFDINQTFANHSGYQNVRELYIQNNRLSEITWLPNQLRVIKLHSNRFERINITLLQNLSNLKNITLHNNPWMCTCKNVDFMSYIQKQAAIIDNISNILCDQTAFYNITKNDLCENSTVALVGITSFFIIFTLTTTTLLIAFYHNQDAIRVWCYKHKVFLWWVYKKENDMDKDKKYDAFVCHAHQDEDFVTQQLIPNLEECESPFKLCIHSRDWLAGDMIPDQIARAVSDSRRTLVLLSPHFLESSWAKMEFRAAHKNALDEGRSRVIVIKLGDVDEDKLDDELKAYLKLNTYIEWGHKTFWDNLRYALPHQQPLSKRAKLLSQHIKKAIGDKQFELQTVASNIPQITTSDNNKNPLILRELLNNLQKQIVQENNVNRNIA